MSEILKYSGDGSFEFYTRVKILNIYYPIYKTFISRCDKFINERDLRRKNELREEGKIIMSILKNKPFSVSNNMKLPLWCYVNYPFLNKKPKAKEWCRKADLTLRLNMIEPVGESKLMLCDLYVQSVLKEQ